MEKVTAITASVLLVMGMAGAVVAMPGTMAALNTSSNQAIQDAEVDASYDQTNETVTVLAMDQSDPIHNASVALDGDHVGYTDANGTLTVSKNVSEELEVTVEKDTFTAELEYLNHDGELVLLAESYEYHEMEHEEDEHEEDEHEEDEEDEHEEDEHEEAEHEEDEHEEDEEDEHEADEDDDNEGRGPPDGVPRGPPNDVPRGPPEHVPRGPPSR